LGEAIVKKIWLPVLAASFLLAACGTDKAEEKKEETKQDVAASDTEAKDKTKQVASLVDPRLEEPKEDTMCEMRKMNVYMKD